jgi:uncharacterized membrane protein YkgB
MEQASIDSKRVEDGVKALTARSREARPLIMRWAVATVALADIVRSERDVALSWPEIGVVAARWLEDFGRSTGQWKTHTEAALRMSNMSLAGPASFESEPPVGWFDRLDRWISMQMQRYGFFLLRISLGIVFIWFGALKPLGLSPADDLVTKTLPWIPPKFLIPFLGLWEMAIGVGIIYRPLLRVALLLLFLHLPGTALPLFLLRDICFTHFPYALTLEGQYIIKNLTLVSAAIVVGGTVRHGRTRKEQERVTWWL